MSDKLSHSMRIVLRQLQHDAEEYYSLCGVCPDPEDMDEKMAVLLEDLAGISNEEAYKIVKKYWEEVTGESK